MSKETRKIILKKDEPSQEIWIGKAFSAEKGKAISVDEKTAVRAMDTDKFDYVGEDVEIVEANPDALPENFPHKEDLLKSNIKTFSELNLTSDEGLLKISGIGKQSLKQIRDFAAQGETNE